MDHVGGVGAPRELARPRLDLALEVEIVKRGEHAVGRSWPILERRMHRHAPGRALEADRAWASQRCVELRGLDIRAVEGTSVGVWAEV